MDLMVIWGMVYGSGFYPEKIINAINPM